MSKPSKPITINTPISIDDKIFEEAANDITTAANMLIIASLCLRVSFIIGERHDELSEIRTRVYINARLYDGKIIPFAQAAVSEIKTFCESPGIKKDSSFNDFKSNISNLKNAAYMNVQLCEFILIFHEAILKEFKLIQNDAAKLALKLGLDEKEYNKRKNRISSDKYNWATGLALIPEVRSIILPILGIEIEDEQILHLENDSLEIVAAIDTMLPLIESIRNYTKSLTKVSGFFNKLFADLEILEGKIKKEYISDQEGKFYFDIIQGKAGEISDACDMYLIKASECSVNISCIEEDYDKKQAKEWILQTVKNSSMHKEFDDLLSERPGLSRKMLKA